MSISMIFEMIGLSLIFPLIDQISNSDLNKFSLFIINKLSFLLTDKYHLKLLDGNFDVIVFLILIILFVYTIKFLILLTLDFAKSNFQFKIQEFVTSRLFQKYLQKDLFFHLKSNSSILTRNITKEVDEMTINSVFPILLLLTDFFTLAGIMIILCVFQPFETISSIFLGLSVTLIFLRSTKKIMQSLGDDRQFVEGEKLKIFNQSLKSIKEIKIYNKEKFFFNYFAKFNKKFTKIATKQSFLNFLPQSLFEYLAIIGVLSFIFIFSLSDKTNSEILATLGLFVAAIFRSIPASFRIVSCINRLIYSFPSLQLLSTQLPNNDALIFNSLKKNYEFKSDTLIEIKNLSFHYQSKEKKHQIFLNTNISISKNDIIGIQGLSGSGKTTLINILLGLLKPEKGLFYIDETKKNFNFLKGKGMFSYVPQEIYLADDNIINNIVLNLDKNKINYELLNKSLEISQSKNFIDNFPHKLNTFVGEGGVNLSGGQKQRIGIARAIYNKAPILVLDEATSALDVKTEKKIVNNLFSLTNLTIIIISHRKSIINLCNVVYEVKNKKVNEVKSKRKLL